MDNTNNIPNQSTLLPAHTPQADAPTDNPEQQNKPTHTSSSSPLHHRTVLVSGLSEDMSQQIHNLAQSISQRLSLMPEMAALKIKLSQPVEDKAREKVVIERATEFAREISLDVNLAENLVKAQIRAAKHIQNQHKQTSSLSRQEAENRKEELRKEIITLGKSVLNTLAPLQHQLQQPDVQQTFNNELSLLLKQNGIPDEKVPPMIENALFPKADT